MQAIAPRSLELSEAWVDGDPSARWMSAAAHAAAATGSSVLEVPPGCRLPVHTDSEEEVVVVVEGRAEVVVAGESASVDAGGFAIVPRLVEHEVRNAGDGPLRFLALYAGPDVVSTYADEVQPDGGREREATP
jgi:mannose-6-phosphate isomerase-like protein (cupin superfamily)